MAACAIGIVCSTGCSRNLYDPALATRSYPEQLHTTNIADMQVFRRDTNIEIVNSTATSYHDFDVWVNQRYVRHVDALPAGESITLSLWEFRDDNGDAFYAGGFFRAYEATRVRLTEIQTVDDQQMTGLVTIRKEDVPVKPDQR